MRIALFGTFDVDNYGDLLFPHIAKYRWPDCELIAISPTSNSPNFTDCIPPINFLHAKKKKFDAIVIGGGNIIHSRKTSLKDYENIPELAYPLLWIGAAELAVKKKIPFAFNAPGISDDEFDIVERTFFPIVFDRCSYLSFREEISTEIASKFTKNSPLTVPDTAFDIANMWPLGKGEIGGYISVNLNKRYHSPPEITARYLDMISKELNLKIKLIVIGACHGDLEFSKLVQKEIKTDNKLEVSTSLKEIAHLIGKSSFFIGSSMHGFITALAYNVPGILVLNRRPMKKFNGLIRICNLSPEVICPTWEHAFKQVNKPALLTNETKEKINKLLNDHWNIMREKISLESKTKKSIYLGFWGETIFLLRKLQKIKDCLN